MGFLRLYSEVHRLGDEAVKAQLEWLGMRRDLEPSFLTWQWLRQRARARVAALKLVVRVDRASGLLRRRSGGVESDGGIGWSDCEAALGPMRVLQDGLVAACRCGFTGAWLVDDVRRQLTRRFGSVVQDVPAETGEPVVPDADEQFWRDLTASADLVDEACVRRELAFVARTQADHRPSSINEPWPELPARPSGPTRRPPIPKEFNSMTSWVAPDRLDLRSREGERIVDRHGLRAPLVRREDIVLPEPAE